MALIRVPAILILDETRPFAPSSRPKQKYPGGASKETSGSCHYMPLPMPILAPPPQYRPRPTSWPRQLNSAERSSPRSSRNRLREHTPELRTGCEVKFAPADLSSSVRETSVMGANGTVPVSKMSSVFAPLLLHLAPAEHRIQALENKGPRTLTWGCTNAQSGSLGR